MQNKYKGENIKIQLLKCITLGAEIDAINKIKGKATAWENISEMHIAAKMLESRAQEESKSVRKKKKAQYKKWTVHEK